MTWFYVTYALALVSFVVMVLGLLRELALDGIVDVEDHHHHNDWNVIAEARRQRREEKNR